MASFINSLRRSFKKKKRPALSINTQSTGDISRAPPTPNAPPEVMQMPQLDKNYSAVDVSRGTLRSKSATLMPGMSIIESNEKNFWDINGYKRTLKRVDEGYELNTKLIEMLQERSKLEDAYARSLKQWSKKWKNYLDTETTEYGTTLEGWHSLLKTGDDAAEIHFDLCKKIASSSIHKVRQWVTENYQKHILTILVKKQFQEEFEEAQKPWAKSYEKMIKAKKDYYSSIKKTKSTEQAAKFSQSSSDKSEDQKRKLQQEAELAKSEQERARERYKDEVHAMDLSKERYETNMKKVFQKTQNFEKARKEFFHEIFSEYHSFLLEQVRDSRHLDILKEYNDMLATFNADIDLKLWSESKGADMEPTWPIFEEYFG
jgi:protein kinase C and casein kinase substrate in neurons protein